MIILSLFDGISCGQVALERAGIKVEKYYASEIDKYAIQVTQKNYPNTIQLGDITKWKEWNIEKPDMIIGGSPCFIAGTKIITKMGIKNIEDIVLGDYVLTHNNRFKKVLKVGGSKNKETILTKIQGIIDITSTLDHPFYVRTLSKKWDNIKRTSYRHLSNSVWKEASLLKKGDFLGFPILTTSENILNITDEEAFIIGRYIADGHTRKDFRVSEGRPKDRHWQLILSVGDSKLDNFKEKIKENQYSCYSHSSSVHRCVFSSKRLVRIVEDHCGCGAENKFISMSLLNLPKNLLSILIDGYLSGDGSFRNNTYRASTVSSDLVFSLSLAVAKVYGVGFSYEFTKSKPFHIIQERTVNQRDSYTLSFAKEIKKQSNYIIDGNIVWLPFKKSFVNNIRTDVYNLEVKEDNSYTANGVFVHNCQGFSFAGKQLNFGDDRSKLFFVFIDILNHFKPKYFLLENVIMKKEYENVISKYIGIYPIEINSSLVSAQNRRRLYWTNIKTRKNLFGKDYCTIPQPKDKKIYLKDIIENNDVTDREKSYCIDRCYFKGGSYEQYVSKSRRQLIIKAGSVVGRNPDNPTSRETGLPTEQILEIRSDEKTGCLTSVNKDNVIISGRLGKYNFVQEDNIYSTEGKSPTITKGEANSRIKIEEENESKFNYLEKSYIDDMLNMKFKQTNRITDIEKKALCLRSQGGGRTGMSSNIIHDKINYRQLTPIECERLQTVNTVYEIGIKLCLDQAKNYVNVVEKNLKLQKLVLNVEKIELIEFAKLVEKCIKQKNQSIKFIVPQNANMKILQKTKECMKNKQKEKFINVKTVEKKTMFNYQNLEEDFVIQNVFTNITQDQIVNNGKEELHRNDNPFQVYKNGKMQLNMYGKEIMQLVQIVGTTMEQIEIEKCMYTTLYHLNTNSIEQMLIILYWYAKNVIILSIQEKIQIKSLLLTYNFENSYTEGISKTQRYSCLGNGWTVDVIAHIFSYLG